MGMTLRFKAVDVSDGTGTRWQAHARAVVMPMLGDLTPEARTPEGEWEVRAGA